MPSGPPVSPARRNSFVDDSASAHGVAAAHPPNPECQSERESLSVKATEIHHDQVTLTTTALTTTRSIAVRTALM